MQMAVSMTVSVPVAGEGLQLRCSSLLIYRPQQHARRGVRACCSGIHDSTCVRRHSRPHKFAALLLRRFSGLKSCTLLQKRHLRRRRLASVVINA